MPNLDARLHAALRAALKARDRVAVAALRSAPAAIDNAEAVPVDRNSAAGTGPAAGTGNEHVAGSVAGPGATDVDRRLRTEAVVLDRYLAGR